MASVLNTNMASITAQRYLTSAQNKLQSSYEKLSSGSRINRAQDDAAGMGISQKLVASINSSAMAIRNANDAIGAAQTAEGAMSEISTMLQRFKELAVQGGNSALSGTQRGFLVGEMLQLREEIYNVASRTKFNGNSLLNNTTAPAVNNIRSLVFQTGEAPADVQNVTVYDLQATSPVTNEQGADLFALLGTYAQGTNTDANFLTAGASGIAFATYAADSTATSSEFGTALQTAIDNAINFIAAKRASYGSLINRLNANVNNLTALHENLSAANSRVVDTDYANETASLTKTQILQQAATAMLSQANASPNVVLALLK
ncbi:MAG: flagellin FliC [Betaproteobacteria bacterium]|nr:flagellin FliC [Betaproteobacteria bacterium]